MKKTATKNDRWVMGIDPGKFGAIAILDSTGAVVRLTDMPNTVGGVTLAMFRPLDAGSEHIECWIESQHPRPKEGVSSSYSHGEHVGTLLGIAAVYGYEVKWVSPQVWKQYFGLIKKDKSASIARAKELYPEIGGSLSRRKDHGRAEALLIARFGFV